MFELSLHILDLAQNSIRAGATVVLIRVIYDTEKGTVVLELMDDGCGMDGDFLKKAVSPFTTTRASRKVGLGIPMLKQLAEQCGGSFTIESQPGKGTRLTACFAAGSIDLPPLGDLVGTIRTLMMGAPDKPEFVLEYRNGKGAFRFDTRDVRKALGGLSPAQPEVLLWAADYIKEGLDKADQQA